MILHRPYCGNHQPSMASGMLRCVWQSVTMSPFHLFRVSLLSAYKQIGRVLFPALPKWTVWPGSHQKPEVSVLIFLPPRHITMTTDIEITSSPGKKSLGDTTQWHFCGTWGEQGSFRRAGQGWVFSPLKRKDQAGQREEVGEALVKELWCRSSHAIHQPERGRWLIHLFLK